MVNFPTIVPCTHCGKNVRYEAAMTVKGQGSYHSACAREVDMGMRVELTEKQQKELDAMKEKPVFQSTLMGHCAQCGRGIPHGYVPVVTKYESVAMGASKVAKPVEMFCKECSPSVNAPKKEKKKAPVVEISAGPMNDGLAKKLMTVMSTTKPHSPRWMLKRLKLDIDKKEAITTLQKLQAAGKVALTEGQWLLK